MSLENPFDFDSEGINRYLHTLNPNIDRLPFISSNDEKITKIYNVNQKQEEYIGTVKDLLNRVEPLMLSLDQHSLKTLKALYLKAISLQTATNSPLRLSPEMIFVFVHSGEHELKELIQDKETLKLYMQLLKNELAEINKSNTLYDLTLSLLPLKQFQELYLLAQKFDCLNTFKEVFNDQVSPYQDEFDKKMDLIFSQFNDLYKTNPDQATEKRMAEELSFLIASYPAFDFPESTFEVHLTKNNPTTSAHVKEPKEIAQTHEIHSPLPSQSDGVIKQLIASLNSEKASVEEIENLTNELMSLEKDYMAESNVNPSQTFIYSMSESIMAELTPEQKTHFSKQAANLSLRIKNPLLINLLFDVAVGIHLRSDRWIDVKLMKEFLRNWPDKILKQLSYFSIENKDDRFEEEAFRLLINKTPNLEYLKLNGRSNNYQEGGMRTDEDLVLIAKSCKKLKEFHLDFPKNYQGISQEGIDHFEQNYSYPLVMTVLGSSHETYYSDYNANQFFNDN